MCSKCKWSEKKHKKRWWWDAEWKDKQFITSMTNVVVSPGVAATVNPSVLPQQTWGGRFRYTDEEIITPVSTDSPGEREVTAVKWLYNLISLTSHKIEKRLTALFQFNLFCFFGADTPASILQIFCSVCLLSQKQLLLFNVSNFLTLCLTESSLLFVSEPKVTDGKANIYRSSLGCNISTETSKHSTHI